MADGPSTLEKINGDIPPHDISWTETIVGDVIERGWIRALSSEPPRYELTDSGYAMLKALDEIPQSIKEAARKSVLS